MSLDRHFKRIPMAGCSDPQCCGVYPPEDTYHCPECMVEWPCEVELLRQRAERAEAELVRFKQTLPCSEMVAEMAARAERAEALSASYRRSVDMLQEAHERVIDAARAWSQKWTGRPYHEDDQALLDAVRALEGV